MSIIRPRHGIKSLWNKYKNRVYERGEMLVESPERGVGTGPVNIKFGDGVTSYENLPYAVEAPISECVDGSTKPLTSGAGYTLKKNLEDQIATIVANNNDTEGNSELVDIRTGADGTTYTSAGEAVRKQFLETVKAEELLDIEYVGKSANLLNLKNHEETNVGVTVSITDNDTVVLSGTSTGAGYIYLPLEEPIQLTAGLSYCLSLQNFVTENTGVVVYPCNGTTPIDVTNWLLSEASAMNGGGAVYIPNEDKVIDALRLHIATGRTVDNTFNVQIEQNTRVSDWVPYYKGDKVMVVKPTMYRVPGNEYVMNYLYVSNEYTEATDGYGITRFKSIYDANSSIGDNSRFNRYTIIVKPGVYTDLQERYAGLSDVDLIGYRGIMTKDYVYYESENIYNPSETVIKWDGAVGFDTATLISDDIIKKCPFHLAYNVHTHIKGFTFDCKNIRYGIHLETGGQGYASEWVVDHCIFIWGGRADCTDYKDKTTVPVFGCGHSFGEKGVISNCKIVPTNCTVGYQNHENADNSDFELSTRFGADITIKNCDFAGTSIQARTLKGEYADTNNILTIDNCINVSEIVETYDNKVADRCDWLVRSVNMAD